MVHYRNQTAPLSGETADLQHDDAPETGRERTVMEIMEEKWRREIEEYKRRVDRMIELAAEIPIVLRPGLRESEAYDFFISHVREDKEDLVDELVQELRNRGAKVRCDDCILREGDNLRRRIDEGLENCLFGVVVLTSDFFAKGWQRKELDNLISPETRDSDKRIFPLRRRVSKDEVLRHSSRIPDWTAFTTTTYFIEDIAEKMLQAKELHLANYADGASS